MSQLGELDAGPKVGIPDAGGGAHGPGGGGVELGGRVVEEPTIPPYAVSHRSRARPSRAAWTGEDTWEATSRETSGPHDYSAKRSPKP